MLTNADERDMTLFINERELVVVIFVGKLTRCDVTERKMDCTLEDCSGNLQVTKWIDEDQAQPEVYPEGSYVTVYGKPSVFNGQPQLNAYKMMKCQSYDEVTRHYMSVIYADLQTKKGGLDIGRSPVEAAAKMATTSSIVTNDCNDDEALTKEQNELLKLIMAHQEQNEHGVNVNWLSQQLKRDIKDDLTYLMNEGQIYDTVNEEWVKTT